MNLKELNITAKQAMLDIPDPKKLGTAFEEMLAYFSKMMEVDVATLEPTTHALARENRLRSDRGTQTDIADALLDNAPHRKDRFFRIPNVL